MGLVVLYRYVELHMYVYIYMYIKAAIDIHLTYVTQMYLLNVTLIYIDGIFWKLFKIGRCSSRDGGCV